MKLWKRIKSFNKGQDIETSEQSIGLLLIAFYGLKGIIVIRHAGHFFHSRDLSHADWLWPLSWLDLVSAPHLWITFLFALSALLPFLAVFRPFNPQLKFVEACAFFFFAAAVNSFGKIDHNLHAFLFSSFFLAFIGRGKNSETQKTNSGALQAASASLLFIYGMAGIWKLRHYLRALFDSQTTWDALLHPLSYHLGRNFIENGHDSPLVRWLLESGAFFQTSAWMLVAVFETLCLLVIFRPKIYRIWGCAIILFHASTDLVMNITFEENQLLALLLLILFPVVWSNPESERKE